MNNANPSIFLRLFERVFPKMPDFFGLLAEQCIQVTHTVELLVDYMETSNPVVGQEVKCDEHRADEVKVQNIHMLNEAFSTPIDREDIYRAIMDMDEVVNYCKTTVSEMDLLVVGPDKHTMQMSYHLKEGVIALSGGFAKLSKTPKAAAADADAARKSERRVEKCYRQALADLFQGDDYIEMFKRREIYRHLSNAADRMAHCANTLHDIVVKIS